MDEFNTDAPGPDATEDLAARAGSDDGTAFDLLYTRIAPALLAWAEIRLHARLKRLVDPEDVVQEVWIRAMRRYREEEKPAVDRFRPWVFGIAQFVIVEALRRTRHDMAGPASKTSPLSLDKMPASVTSLSRELRRQDVFRVFLEHVETLGDEERNLLLYRGLEGQDHAEVARRMGIDAAAVRQRWARLRSRLRELKLPEHLLEPE